MVAPLLPVSMSTALIAGLARGQSFAMCPLCPHWKQSPFFINSSQQHAQARSISMGPGPDVAGGHIGGAARVVVVTLLCTRVDVRLLVVQGG